MSTLTIELPDGMKPASDLQGSHSRVGNASADEAEILAERAHACARSRAEPWG
jgi:hypothetical protein